MKVLNVVGGIMQPIVSFGFVNCNRLFYLKSCVESLIECSKSFDDKEIIIVDNASSEEGTIEYLNECKDCGIIVIRQEERDPSNEFAKALNKIIEISRGDFICAMAADVQFVMKGDWISDYVNFYIKNESKVGSILLDAQRRFRCLSEAGDRINNDLFVLSSKRLPLTPSCHSFTSKEKLNLIYPWEENMSVHEGGDSAEAVMIKKINEMKDMGIINFQCAIPLISPAVTIYNDQGDNAKIRLNKRYGNYFAPMDTFKYYEILDYNEFKNNFLSHPLGIEDIAKPIGWSPLKDANGNWLKKPLDLSKEFYEEV